MATKKTAAKKVASKRQPRESREPKEATELTDIATADKPDAGAPDDVEPGKALVPVPVTTREEDPVLNAIRILRDRDAVEILSGIGVSNLEILTATNLATPANAVRYLQSYVETDPDIDSLVDRETERAALMGYQAWTASGRDEKTLESFLRRRWGLPVHTGTVVPSGPAGPDPNRPPAQQAGVDGWVPQVPNVLAETREMSSVQTYDQAFDQARQEGYFNDGQ